MAQYTVTTTPEQEAALQAEIARENLLLESVGRPWSAEGYVQDIVDTRLNPLVAVSKSVETDAIVDALAKADPVLRDRIKADLGLDEKGGSRVDRP